MSLHTTPNALKTLTDIVAQLTPSKKSGVKEAFLRRVLIPQFSKDIEFALDFVTKEPYLFLACFDLNLLKECDFSDLVFLLDKKNYIRPLGMLASVARGFNLSDEAAWILMERIEANKAAQIDNIFHSIWFRRFTDENIWNDKTVSRFNKALDKASSVRVALGDSYDKRLYPLGTARFKEGILNFHLGKPWDKYRDFNTYRLIINDTFLNKETLVGVEKDILNWALPLFEVSKANKLPRLLYPVILYSNEINMSVKELYQERMCELIPEVGSPRLNPIRPRKWHSVLTSKEIHSFIKDYPNLCDSLTAPFIRYDSLWNMSTNQFIDEVLKSDLVDLLPKSQKKSFTLLMARSLKEEFDVKVDVSSFAQLLSIYSLSKEEEVLV